MKGERVTMTTAAAPVARRGTETKIDWTREFLIKPGNGALTVQEIREAVRKKFGTTLGTPHLNRIIREVRQTESPRQVSTSAAGDDTSSPAPTTRVRRGPPTQDGIETPARALVRELTIIANLHAGQVPAKEVATICGAAMRAAGIEQLKVVDEKRVEVMFTE
jgi:hypothetical protein